MKSLQLFLLFVGLITFDVVHSQQLLSAATQNISLKIQGSGGTNGIAVTYNPKLKVYYTTFAGNATFPLEMHGETGAFMQSQDLGVDARGCWYNEKTKQLQGIIAGNGGSYTIHLDGVNFSTLNTNTVSYGMGFNDIARFNKGKVYFLNEKGLHIFKLGKAEGAKVVYPDIFKEKGTSSFNYYGFFHTGIKGMEIGVYYTVDKTFYFFNEKNGKTTGKIKISEMANYTSVDYFKISFCNKRIFVFDSDDRKWDGFQVFE